MLIRSGHFGGKGCEQVSGHPDHAVCPKLPVGLVSPAYWKQD